MKSGILIIARVGSSRLPKKHLITSAGHPFIEWLVNRFLAEFHEEIKKGNLSLIIASSTEPGNEIFESIFSQSPVSVFYGPTENIPLRQLKCAQAYGLDKIISIDGDDILCSVSASRKVFSRLVAGSMAVKTTGLPLGMNLLGYDTNFLDESLTKALQSGMLETGWGRIFDEGKFEKINLGSYDQDDRLRFTLDYEEDAIFFQRIIEDLNGEVVSISDEKLINYVIENKLFEINAALKDTYWDNFNAQKNSEV